VFVVVPIYYGSESTKNVHELQTLKFFQRDLGSRFSRDQKESERHGGSVETGLVILVIVGCLVG
jgi:hypothetical protein